MVGTQVADLDQVTPDERIRIGRLMRQRYPGYPLEMLIETNVDGVATELARELALAR